MAQSNKDQGADQATPAGGGTEAWLSNLLYGREFTPKQLAVARYIEGNVYTAETRTASEIAELSGVNVATVVRFAQSLGFSGWPSFQAELQSQHMSHLTPSQLATRRTPDTPESLLDEAVTGDIRNLQSVLQTVGDAEVKAIAGLIAAARRTVVISSGSFAAIGQVLEFNAAVMGFPVRLYTPGGPELSVALAGLDERDLVIGISFWRLSHQVVGAMSSARRRRVPTAVITDSVLSPFARTADHSLVVPTTSTNFQSLTAAVSVTYAVLAHLREIGGEAVRDYLRRVETAYDELSVLEQ